MSTLKLPDKQPTLRIKARPNDANKHGDIFGGWLMSQIDLAGGELAYEYSKGPIATIAVKELTLLKPVFIYDVISLYAELIKVGTTSITIAVETYAQRWEPLGLVEKISDAIIVYVAIQKPGEKRNI